MSKMYIGIDNKAISPKNAYIGVDNFARRIKKAYMGMNGKAELIFQNNVLPKYDEEKSNNLVLTIARNSLAATTVGNYAIFSGGDADEDRTGVVRTCDVFNNTLSRIQNDIALTTPRYDHSACSTKQYAFFIGGTRAVDGNHIIDTFDKDLNCKSIKNSSYNNKRIESYPSASTVNKIYCTYGVMNNDLIFEGQYYGIPHLGAGAGIKNRVFFAGGRSGGKCIDTAFYIDEDTGAASSLPALTTGYCELSGTTIKNYIIFAGGRIGDGEIADGIMTIYDYDGTKILSSSDHTGLGYTTNNEAATSVNEHAIFIGCHTRSDTNTFCIIDEDLNVTYEHIQKNTVGYGYAHWRDCASTTVGNYALFAGGLSNYYEPVLRNQIDIFS